jgi:Asp-tRNA(Asn)/Glu-tRNA(Gln) amidotransferase A subunit family amidase
MARTLEDAVIVLEIISGRQSVYRDALGLHRLDGIRLLVPTNLTDWKGNSYLHFGQKERFLKGLRILEELGADIVEAALPPKFISIDRSFALQQIPMENEFVHDLEEHLRTAYKV